MTVVAQEDKHSHRDDMAPIKPSDALVRPGAADHWPATEELLNSYLAEVAVILSQYGVSSELSLEIGRPPR